LDRKKGFAALGLPLLALLLLTGCSQQPEITVGSKNFAEQLILGELVSQHLENTLHVHVRRKLDLGGTLLAHKALQAGEIDLYPEYTGTALTAILKQPPDSDPAAVLRKVREAYKPWNLEWSDPIGFNNTFAMVIRKEDADARNAHTITEAANFAKGWKLGVGYEFVTRPDGLPGLIGTYRLNVKGSVKTMDLGLLYQALEQGQVDMVAGNSTDGQLAAKPFVVLNDDRHYFPPYEAAWVVRTPAYQKFPGLREALAKLHLTTDQIRELNHELDSKHTPVREIARKFLAEHQ
jgi:osmoprotectant transport system substrate-binding protein